nr:hypothetical protein [Tanacetum cinerariifolium]
ALHEVERRQGNVNVALVNKLPHIAEEEREDERANVRTVDISIGHDDDFVVAQLAEVQRAGFVAVVVGAESQRLPLVERDAERGNHVLDFLVFQNLVLLGFLHVQDFTAQRQDGLKRPVAAHFGGAAGRVPFHEVE